MSVQIPELDPPLTHANTWLLPTEQMPLEFPVLTIVSFLARARVATPELDPELVQASPCVLPTPHVPELVPDEIAANLLVRIIEVTPIEFPLELAVHP